MNSGKSSNRYKIVIVVLSILIGISILLLAINLVYKYKNDVLGSDIIRDNMINTKSSFGDSVSDEASVHSGRMIPLAVQVSAAEPKTSIELYSKNAEENTPFAVNNMFPGDVEKKNYRVKVSYENEVVVRFRADVRDESEKLAEVLKCKVALTSTGETLYDGLMREMPSSLNHTLKSNKTSAEELTYEITAYLDTSVGNEYMEKELIADFKWWVEETGNLKPMPGTGDSSNIVVWIGVFVIAAAMVVFVICMKKREGKRDE